MHLETTRSHTVFLRRAQKFLSVLCMSRHLPIARRWRGAAGLNYDSPGHASAERSASLPITLMYERKGRKRLCIGRDRHESMSVPHHCQTRKITLMLFCSQSGAQVSHITCCTGQPLTRMMTKSCLLAALMRRPWRHCGFHTR